jgi:predicted transcriptional regulator
MTAKKLEVFEPVLGEHRTAKGSSALSEIKLTPRSEFGAARIHTKNRKTTRRKQTFKSVDEARAFIADQESQIAALNDQLRAAHDENREMGAKYKKLLRQVESIYIRAADAVENVD